MILKSFYAIGKRELERILSAPVQLFCMIVAPIVSTLFFLSLMQGGLPTNLPTVVVDMDNTATTRKLIRQVDAFQQVSVLGTTADFAEARKQVQQGKAYAIFYIPKDFTVMATAGKRPKLSFYTNYSILIPGSLIYRDLRVTAALAGASVGLQRGLAEGKTETQVMAALQPIVLDTHAIGNPWLNYSVYLNNTIIPGILQLMIFLVTTFSIGMEIKRGTSKEWLKLGNGSMLLSLVGKLFPHTVIFTIVGFLCSSILYGYNAFPLESGWLPMLSAMFLLIIASQAVGVFMIGVLPVLRLGLSFASLFGMLAFSIVGFSFPSTAMHPTLQALAKMFPLRHYFLIYVDQGLNGRELIYTWSEYVWLLAFLFLPFLILRNLKSALLSFYYIP